MKYQLPCSCGKTILIESSQAGQKVRCVCGNEMEAPTMRLIRQLTPLRSQPQSKPKRAKRWSLAQRLAFATGLFVMTCGLAVSAFFQWGRSGLDTEPRAWDITLESDIDRLKQMDLTEAWANWMTVRETSIGPYIPPPHVQTRWLAEYWLQRVKRAMGVALVGLVILLTAFVIPGPRGRPAKKRPTPDPSAAAKGHR